jgi:hypothetical protein
VCSRNTSRTQHFNGVCSCKVDRDSSVGIATLYGLGGPWIESRWGRDFQHPSRLALKPTLLYNGYRVSFPVVKRPGRGVDHPPPSSAGVKQTVQLYLYSTSGPSWPVIGRSLPLRYVPVSQWFLNCAPWIPRDPRPVPRGSLDTFL